ncbi:hypothetical protein BKA62DRAFT_511806 [Auriculariales sp. MPI-PUGE-AT-0066]|nr:hypothetical protein BKA62DRAFT_511806 [Auriculariales sp. MPI-PUGE-AT-0066]
MKARASPYSSDVEEDQPTEDWQRPRPLSCKECRRAKLKCDRKIPCGSCKRRGCESICPDGIVTSGPANVNRGMLSDNRKLREKLLAMHDRVEQLENAVATLRAPRTSGSGSPSAEDTDDLARAFGTLDIGERPTFVGPNATSNYLAPRASSSKQRDRNSSFERFITVDSTLSLSAQLPNIVHQVRERLPPEPVAQQYVHLWLSGGALVGDTVAGQELLLPIMAKVYASPPAIDEGDLHAVAVLFVVFAHVCLFAPDAEANERESRKNSAIACDLLHNVHPVLLRPTLDGVSALFILSWYYQLLDDSDDAGPAHIIHGLLARVCHTMGLHRNDTPWTLEPAERQRRRSLFWSAVTVDCYVAENLGRPPSFSPAHVDALLPDDPVPIFAADGSRQESFQAWFLSFTARCLMPLLSHAMGTQRVDHGTVQRIDALFRSHPVADSLRLREPLALSKSETGLQDLDPASLAKAIEYIMLVMKQHTIYLLTQKMIMLLHRPFFVMGIREPEGVETPHVGSIIAAYDAALKVARCARSQYALMPTARPVWFVWNAAFSACAILGAFVIHRPHSPLISGALEELEATYETFGELSSRSKLVSRLMPQLGRIREAAQRIARARDHDPVIGKELEFMLGRARTVGKPAGSPSASSSESSVGVVTPSSIGSHSLPYNPASYPSSLHEPSPPPHEAAPDPQYQYPAPTAFRPADRSPLPRTATYEILPVVVQVKPVAVSYVGHSQSNIWNDFMGPTIDGDATPGPGRYGIFVSDGPPPGQTWPSHNGPLGIYHHR